MGEPHPLRSSLLVSRMLSARESLEPTRKRYVPEDLVVHPRKMRRNEQALHTHEEEEEEDESTAQETIGNAIFENKEPCMFSEDEAEEEMHRNIDAEELELESEADEECPFCADNSAYAISDEISTNRNNIIAYAQDKIGRVRNDILFDSILEDHRTYVEKPLAEHGIRTPKLTHKKIRDHFNPKDGKLHEINLKRITGETIKDLVMLEKKLMRSAVCVRDTTTNQRSIDRDRQKDLQSTQKVKLDYMKFYRSLEDGEHQTRGGGRSRRGLPQNTSVRGLSSHIRTPASFLNNY